MYFLYSDLSSFQLRYKSLKQTLYADINLLHPPVPNGFCPIQNSYFKTAGLFSGLFCTCIHNL